MAFFKRKIMSICLAGMITATLFSGCSSQEQKTENVGKETATQQAQTDEGKKDTENTSSEKQYQVESLKMEAYGGDRGGPNPFLQKTGGPADQKVRYIFDGLLNEGEKDLEPWLAKEWSMDGNTYTFKLNENALWHDGEKVTAEDVKFTIDYYKEHNPQPQLIVSGDYNGLSAEIVDDYTVDITVENNDATVLDFIGTLYILPEHIWKDVEDPYTFTNEKAYIGCGMYKYESYDSATGAYSYVAFDDYYGPEVAAKRIEFVPVSDRILAFENKEIDLVDISADVMDKYKEDPNIGFITKDNDMLVSLVFNFDLVPELKDVEVRKALFQAINLEAIVENVWRGEATAGSAGVVSPVNRFYNEDVIKYDYDVEAAKKVLEGKNISFKLTVPSSTYYTDMAQMIKMDLAKVGVDIEIEAGTGSWMQDYYDGNVQAVMTGHGMANRTPEYLRLKFDPKYANKAASSSCGPIGWSNDEITDLCEKSLAELDPDKRMDYFKQIQYKISEELPILPICTFSTPYIYRKDYYDGWTKSFDYEQFDYCRVAYLKR